MNMVDSDRGKLFVGGISRDTTEIYLKDYFSQYGEISFSTIPKDRMTGMPRGFGFVNFADPSSSDRALADHHEILGKTVEVKRALPRSEQQQFHPINRGSSVGSTSTNNDDNQFRPNVGSTSTNSGNQFKPKKIFVGGLSDNLTEEEFKGYFEKFGTIIDAVVMHNSMTNRPRGFGFITFDSEDVVEEILKNRFHELGGKFVEVKRAIPKDPINSGSGQSSRMGGRDYDNFYLNHDFMSPYGYNGVYNGGYHMPGYGFPGFGMPMVAAANSWNGLHMSRYGPLLYALAPVYHMNSVFGALSVGASDGVGDIKVAARH